MGCLVIWCTQLITIDGWRNYDMFVSKMMKIILTTVIVSALLWLTYLSSSLQVEHKVDTTSLYSVLFFVPPHVIFRSFSYPSTVRRKVVFGLPTGRFPCCVHMRAVFVILAPSILKTCPSHLNLLCVISIIQSVNWQFDKKLMDIKLCTSKWLEYILQ